MSILKMIPGRDEYSTDFVYATITGPEIAQNKSNSKRLKLLILKRLNHAHKEAVGKINRAFDEGTIFTI